MARAPGAIRLDALVEGGFSDADILGYQRTRNEALSEGGFSAQDINEYWGTPEPDEEPLMRWAEDAIDTFLDETIGADVDGKRPSITETATQAFTAGLQESVGGLLIRGEEPSVQAPESLLGTSIAGVTSVVSDLPIMIPAAVGGAIAGLAGGPAAPITVPATAAGLAFAVPAGMRASLIDSYRNGSYTSARDFIERTLKVYLETAKAFAVGATTGTAGALARPGLRRLGSEIITLTTVQQGLEGKVPEPRDFVETAAILGGLKVATGIGTRSVRGAKELVQSNLETVYVKTGKQPKEVLQDALEDPSIMEDIVSKNVDLPRAYKEATAEAPELSNVNSPGVVGKAEGKATIVEGKLPPAVVESFTELADTQLNNSLTSVRKYQSINPGVTGALLSDAGSLLHRMNQRAQDGYAGITELKDKVPRMIRNLKKESFKPGGGDSFDVDVRLNSKRRGLDKTEETASSGEILKRIEDADARAKGIDIKLEAAEPDSKALKTARAEKEEVNKELSALRQDLKKETGTKTIRKGTEHSKEVEKILSKYVRDNKQLPVYNEAQWLARESAVAIGERRFNDAVGHLENLETILNDTAYTSRAFEYTKGPNGKLVQFEREIKLEEPAPEVKEFDVEEQKPKEKVEGEAEEPPKPPKTEEELVAEEKAKERGPKAEVEVFDLETAEGRVLDRISTNETGKKIDVGETLHKIYEQAVNRMHPLKRLTDVLADGKEIPTGSDPYKLARLSVASASRAEMALTKEQRNFQGEVIGPALSDILAPLRENAKETEAFRAYLVSKGQLARNDPKAKIELEDARTVVKAGDKQFAPMFKGLVEYQNNLLDLLVDSGRMQKSMAKKAKKLNADFIPWHLLMNEKVPQDLGKVIDPLESIVKNTYTYNHLAIRNHVARSLSELAESNPAIAEGVIFRTKESPKQLKVKTKELQPIAKEIKDRFGIDFTPEELMIFRTETKQVKKDQEISIYRNGQREVWAVPPDVARVFNSLDRATVGILVQLLSLPAKTLRAGAILNPEFTGRNVFRDTVFAGITTPGFRPGWDTVVGLGVLFKDGKAYRDWLFSGGAQATIVAMDRTYLSQNLKDVLNKTNIRSSMRNLIMDEGRSNIASRHGPIEALRMLSEVGENATRLGAFKRTQAKLKKNPGVNATEFDQRMESTFRSREITDFARMGSKMQGANMLVAFLNARIQGEDRAIRAFRDNPGKATFMATATITLPTILLWWANKDDERYQNLPQWQKDLSWIVLTDDTIWRIPKAHTLGLIFGSIPERILNEHFNNAPDAFQDLGEAFGLQQLNSLMPQWLIPFVEEATNHSLSRDRPIIPDALEGLVPELRQTPYTTELTKQMGRVLSEIPGMELSDYTAPIIIDNFIRQWSGGLGIYTMQLLDKALREADVIDDPIKPTVPFEELPFVKAFTIRHPKGSTIHSDEFYSRYQQKKQLYDSFIELAEQGDFESAKRIAAIDPSAMAQLTDMRKAMTDMRKLVLTIPKLPISPDEMRQQIDIALKAMTSIAKAGNEAMDQMEAALQGEFVKPVKVETSPRVKTRETETAPPSPVPDAIASPDPSPPAVVPITPTPAPTPAPAVPSDSSILEPTFEGFDPVAVKRSFIINDVVDDNLLATVKLVNALIHQESRGRAGALSSANAVGLMQILPSTAMSPGLGLERIEGTRSQVIKKLLNPKTNLQFGTQLLNALLDRYGGNAFHALLAYHSGAGFVDKWIKRGSDITKMGKNGRDYVRLISEHLNKNIPDYVKRVQK